MFKPSWIMQPVDTFRLYGAIEKVVEQADGTLRVEGIASSEAVDSQGETIKASAIEKAIPGYLRKDGTGPLREMHQPIAAGKTTAIDVQPDGKTYVVTHVVDKSAVQKVKEKVLQGFSIGGHVPPGGRNKDDAKVIEQIVLTEISLVDRPANPDATFTLVKIDKEAAAAEEKKAEPAAAEVKKDADPAAPIESEVVKRGARFSAGTREKIAKLHGMIQECDKGFSDLAYKDDGGDDDVADAAEIGELAKVQAVKDEKGEWIAKADFDRALEALSSTGPALKKALAERDDLHQKWSDAALQLKAKGVPKDPKYIEAAAKLEELEKVVKDSQDATEAAGHALKKVMKERDELQKERDELQHDLAAAQATFKETLDKLHDERTELTSQRDSLIKRVAVAEVTLQTKGVLKAVPISKGDDGRSGEPEPTSAIPPAGTPERAMYELKKVQSRGGQVVSFGSTRS